MDQTQSQLIEAHNEFQRGYYRKPARSTIAHTASPYIRRHLDEVLRMAAVAPGARILDAGCGMGRHSVLLAERGFQVEGIELSPHLLDQMHARAPHIPAHCADIADPPRPLFERYDAVLGFFVLHHLLDLDAAFAGVAKLLRPGGRAVFIEPNPANPLYYAQIALTPGMKWKAERGILNMRRAKIARSFGAAGLRNPDVFRFGFLPPFLRNRFFGAAVDRAAERIGILEPCLPFQVFRAEKPHGAR
jgi:2-polyprenyl-3-methyl-5-hydroxy-6-metoxy-1,4-benzoquinol methylase